MFVVFIHGPAAAGKYTIGKLVAEQLGLPLVHNHLAVDLATTLFEFGTPEFIRLRAQLWRTTFQAAVDAQRSFVFTFHPEATVHPGLISELTGLVEDKGGAVYFVALLCSEDTVLQRLDAPSRREFGKLRDVALYRQVAAAGGFDFPPLPTATATINTEQLAPSEAARAIIAALP